MTILFEVIQRLKGFPLARARADLAKLETKSIDEIYFWQEKIKWEIARFHFDHNFSYRKKVGPIFPDRWEDLPIIYKSDLQRPIEGLISKGIPKGDLYISNTSGSSGHPFFFAKDKYSHARSWAYVLSRYQRLGLGSSPKEARFYGIPREWKGAQIERLKDFILNRRRFPVFDLSDEVLENFLGRFEATAFDYIYGYTNSVVLFSRFLLRRGILLKKICPSLKLVIVTSEVCGEEDREIIERAAGVDVKSEYGASEFGYIAYEDAPKRWYFAEENLFSESVSSSDAIGEGSGELLFTDLFNRAFPFVRYAIGDLGRIERDEAGRKVLTDLAGRTNDTVRLPSGRLSPGLTFYYISRSILERSGVLKEFIVRQTSATDFVLDIVADRDLHLSEKKEIQEKFDLYLEPGLGVSFKRVEKIPRPANGKLKHFYSEVLSS